MPGGGAEADFPTREQRFARVLDEGPMEAEGDHASTEAARARSDADDGRVPCGCLAVFLLFWLPFLAVFCGLGVRFALAEHARIASFRSVEAEVLSKRVEQRMFQEESGKVRPVYWPVVEYRYRVDGAVLTSRKVLSEAEEGSEPWARGIADGFEVGQVVRAYYDPERPGEAFLLPHPNLALILILIPIPVACAGYRVFIPTFRTWTRGFC
jgi:hypothetical protein